MGKHGAHARNRGKERLKAFSIAAAIAICIAAIAGFAAFGNKPNLHVKTAAPVASEPADVAPSGYYGADYKKLRDTVKNAANAPVLHLDTASILAIDTASEVRAFNIGTGSRVPSIDAEAQRQLEETLAEIEKAGECGFMFLDLQTGKGLCYRPDASPYVASASKAPLAFFVLQQDDAQGRETPEQELAEIAAAIKYSDNDAFDTFGFGHMSAEYADWLAGYGVDYTAEYGLYLNASARSMVAIYNDIYWYLGTDTKNARWLDDCLSNTTHSYIRDGVGDTQAVVRNKGGWIAEEGGVSSTTDAGIVECGGRVYLLAIVTGQPNSGVAQERVAHLVHLLFAQRDALA